MIAVVMSRPAPAAVARVEAYPADEADLESARSLRWRGPRDDGAVERVYRDRDGALEGLRGLAAAAELRRVNVVLFGPGRERRTRSRRVAR